MEAKIAKLHTNYIKNLLSSADILCKQFEPVQDRQKQNVGPDLDPNRLKLW